MSQETGYELMVGREPELREALWHLDQAKGGQPEFIAVGGEPGIGKTLFVSRLRERALEKGFLVADAELTPGNRIRTFGLWEQLFSGRSQEILGVHMAGELAAAFEREDEATAHAVASVLLQGAANQSAVMITIENIHHSDVRSIRLLAEVCAGLQFARLLIVVTFRTTNQEVLSGSLSSILGGSAGVARFDQIILQRLDREEVRNLLETNRVCTDDPALDRLMVESEGNPLVAMDIIGRMEPNRSPVARGKVDPTYPEHLPGLSSELSLRIQNAVIGRTSRLRKTTREVMTAVALFEDGCAMRLLTAAFPERPVADLAGCLSELVNSGLVESIVDSSQELPLYRFRHGLLRSAVLALTAGEERASTHHKVSKAIEHVHAQASSREARTLFRHFLGAPQADDRRKAAGYALAAGKSALKQSEWDFVVDVFSEARTRLRGDLSPAQQAELEFGIGVAYCRTDRRARCTTFFRSAFDYYRSVGNYEKMIDIAVSPIVLDIANPDQYAFIAEARTTVPKDHPRRGELDWAHAHALSQTYGRYEEAERVVRTQLKKARKIGNRKLVSTLLIDWGYVELRMGRPVAALETADELLARCVVEPDPVAELHGHLLRKWAHVQEGNIDKATAAARALGVLSAGFPDALFAAAGLLHSVQVQMRAGDFDGVARETDRSLALNSRCAYALILRSMAEYYRGNIRDGDDFLLRLKDIVDEQPNRGSLFAAAMAQILVHRREITGLDTFPRLAADTISAALDSQPVCAVELRIRIAQAVSAYLSRDKTSAREAYERLTEMKSYHLIPEYRIQRSLALAARTIGNTERAVRHFLHAFFHAQKCGDECVLAWLHADYGDLLASPGRFHNQFEARSNYEESRIAARSMGMRPLVDRLTRSLASRDSHERGDRTARQGRLFTRRQLEVLRMVGEGRSDRQIAMALGVSRFTVSNHVRRILGKTRVESRFALARYARADLHGLDE